MGMWDGVCVCVCVCVVSHLINIINEQLRAVDNICICYPTVLRYK